MNAALRQTPIALTIAGSDSSGGAGIQADLKTFSGLGVYGASVITALTAQNTQGVDAVELVAPAFVTAQFRSVISDLDVGAIKTGMLGSREIVIAVARALEDVPQIPRIVDPVMVATSGDALLAPDAVDALKSLVIPGSALITPNLGEAAALLGCPPALDEAQAAEQAGALMDLGASAVLLKGGHMAGAKAGQGRAAVDFLVDGNGLRRFELPWIRTENSHGTGCTLSAAITAFLARGLALDEAVRRAKAFVWNGLQGGRDLGVGKGRGPLDHQFAVRRDKGETE